MSPTFPAPHIIPSNSKHTHTAILLHGRNSNGKEFASELLHGITSNGQPFLTHDALRGCKWIFPNAPTTYSPQFQENLSEWFDLASTSNPHAQPERQVAGLESAAAYIQSIIDEERKFVSADHIILGGMSQGFATAGYVLLRRREDYAGFIGVSGWLPNIDFVSEEKIRKSHESPRGTTDMPILITHSQDDEVIDVQHGRDAASALREQGFMAVNMKEYKDGGHEIKEPEGFDDIQDFIVGIILEH